MVSCRLILGKIPSQTERVDQSFELEILSAEHSGTLFTVALIILSCNQITPRIKLNCKFRNPSAHALVILPWNQISPRLEQLEGHTLVVAAAANISEAGAGHTHHRGIRLFLRILRHRHTQHIHHKIK